MKLDIIIEVKDSRGRYKAEKQNLIALLSLLQLSGKKCTKFAYVKRVI